MPSMTINPSKMSPDLIRLLKNATKDHPFWSPYLGKVSPAISPFAIHLAILVEPYLHFILEGLKTVESRFSLRRIPPFNSVEKGDVLLLKRSSGPIVGICLVQSIWFYRLNRRTWSGIRKRFAARLCAEDPTFWEARREAAFATLMRITNVQEIDAISFPKRDRRGWIVLLPKTFTTQAAPGEAFELILSGTEKIAK